MTKRTQAAYEFFREHAGYVVGQNAKGALALAKAEEWARENDVTFDWTDDPEPDLSWCECADGSVRHEHEVLNCLATGPDDFSASLCGITDADRDYCRVVEAELASELRHNVEGTRDLYARHFAE
jgi:hypothetical protein